MILVLFDSRFGSQIPASDHDESAPTVHSSFWEAELFYATLIGKPVEVFVMEGFSPEPRLAELLTLLRQALPKRHWRGPYSRAQIVSAVHRTLKWHALQPWSGIFSAASGRLIDSLFYRRGRDMAGGHAESEGFQLLGGPYYDPTVRTDEALVRSLLTAVESGEHTDGDLLDEESRLGRLWLVFRELSGVPFTSPDHVDLLPYWNRLFGQWYSAGAWYGLHGHTHLGVLPAAVAQAKIRQEMRDRPVPGLDPSVTRYPAGALASSRYSLAKKSASRQLRESIMEAALADLERGRNEAPETTTNLLAVRGSVYRELGRKTLAVQDYESVVRFRRENGAPASALGDALSELGYGYLVQGQLRRGRDLIREGVDLLSLPGTRPGFVIRARRKLAVAQLLTGHPGDSWDEFAQARALARSTASFDQLRWK